jgi:hypothetical protein
MEFIPTGGCLFDINFMQSEFPPLIYGYTGVDGKTKTYCSDFSSEPLKLPLDN